MITVLSLSDAGELARGWMAQPARWAGSTVVANC